MAVFNANDPCPFEGRGIVFDTNVWIFIYGNDPRSRFPAYSNFYGSAIKLGNEFHVTDYIISEIFNRLCKIEYGLEFPGPFNFKDYKRNRQSVAFRDRIESVRDTCLNIIDDCTFSPMVSTGCPVACWIEEAGTGEIDFPDIAIREYCRANNFVLVSHDADFSNCGIDHVTSNPAVIRCGA